MCFPIGRLYKHIHRLMPLLGIEHDVSAPKPIRLALMTGRGGLSIHHFADVDC